MKKYNLLFMIGSFMITLVGGLILILIWLFVTKTGDNSGPLKKQDKDSIVIQIKEVPVKVYVHDTIKIKIQCHKEHYETKIDTVQ